MLVTEVVENVARLRPLGEEITWGDVGDELTDIELAELWLLICEYRTAVTTAERIIRDALFRLEAPVEVMGQRIYQSEGKVEKCIDSPGFCDWLSGQDASMIFRVLNPDYVRKGSLPPAVRDTFFEKRPDGKLDVRSIPLEVLGR